MAKGFPAENQFLKIALQPPPSYFPKPSHSPFSPWLLQTTAQNPQVQSLALDSGRWDQKTKQNKWGLWLPPFRHRPPSAPPPYPSTTTWGRRACQNRNQKGPSSPLPKYGRYLGKASSQTEGKGPAS